MIKIQSVGAQGDGLGTTEDGARVFVPSALPGESWRAQGDIFEQAGPSSPDRSKPTCKHFDVCGGCVAQHMSASLYQEWKHNLIVDALSQADIDTNVLPLWTASIESRRRATFEIQRNGSQCVIGFHKRKSHDLFDMTTCTVLAPSIVAALPTLREIGLLVLKSQGNGNISITQIDNGMAISIESKRLQKFAPEVQGKIAQCAKSIRATQVMINGELFVARDAPKLAFGNATLEVPERTFLQAVPDAEAEMQRLVCEALAKHKSIADIFCGVGTFSIPLARQSRVAGFDNDVPAIDALIAAVRHTQGLKPVTAARRDLFRQPLNVRELKGIDGVVINPPRAGAKAQCEQLAKGTIRTIVMVSCNPTTFTRDARILIDGGYTIGPVSPIDQFLWSPHLEVVATFNRR